MSGKHFNAMVIGAFLVLLAGCSAVKVTKEVEFPARQSGMVNTKKLAVFNINGDINGAFTSQVESYFSNIQVRGTTYFEVLERQMLDKIVAEQHMVSSSGLFNEKDAAKLGRLSGADTLITGVVSMPPMSVNQRTKTEQRCKDTKCKVKEDVYFSCVDKNVNLGFTLKAVSVQQGNILFTHIYSGKGSSTECDEGKNKSEVNRRDVLALLGSDKTSYAGIISETELRNVAIRQILDNLRKDVAPYPVMLNIEFMEKDDFMSSATKDKLGGAMEYIKQGRMDRACEIFKDALTSDTNSPALYYNSGVCAEVGSDLDKAEILYNQADRKTSKPVRLISDAINRIKTVRTNQVAVSKQIH
jgi:hypothetical protein